MRILATACLLLALAVYVATHGRDGGWGYLHAAAEAGMVGAIADWFAVTALFRHPLGLPIPHTAIIPRRKAALATGLETFVADNFLTPAVVTERVRSAGVTTRVASWVAAEGNAERVVTEGTPMAQRALASISRADIETLGTQVLVPRLRSEELAPMAGHLLESVVADQAHRSLVDVVATELHRWLTSHRPELAAAVLAQAPWWSPSWVDDRVAARIYSELVEWSDQVRSRPDHPARLALDSYLAELARDLQHDPATRELAEGFKERLLGHPGVVAGVADVWEVVAAALDQALADPDSDLRRRAVHELRTAAALLTGDPERSASWDARIATALAAGVERYGPEVASVISTTIEKWDGREAAERIELHVGRDLQFIRINGTVVGALVGLVLHTISQAIS